MNPRYLGTFVISWSQTEIDGAPVAPVEDLATGACWRWHGDAVRVDGPAEPLVLTGAEGDPELRQRAARAVRRLIGVALAGPGAVGAGMLSDLPDQSFTVTDGIRAFVVTLVAHPAAQERLLMFAGRVPPRDTDLWLVESTVDPRPEALRPAEPGVICFTSGTRIDTPRGVRPVEMLRPGDRVLTRDDGAQEILWIGARRMSGARLHALPQMRPVRICAGAFGMASPEGDLLVSPQHRMLVSGAAARALFNETEVLVEAGDLLDGRAVRIAQGLAEVHYIHLMLPRHSVLRANGVESESFHPALAALDRIAPEQRLRLMRIFPELAADPLAYGGFARRVLSSAEAAILRYDLAA